MIKKQIEMNINLTIAIPVYNRYDYFEEAINSAINQTIKTKIIVVDNNSDHSLFENYVLKIGNPDVKYYRNSSNIGMVNNWNRCIDLCETEWLTILHDDDWLHPNYTEYVNDMQFKYSQSDCFAVGCFYNNIVKEEYHQKIDSNYYVGRVDPKYFLFRNISPFPGICFRISIAMIVGKFEDTLYPCSDFDYWIRISFKNPIIKSSIRLAMYRQSPVQATHSLYLDLTIKTFLIREKYFKESIGQIEHFLSLYSLFEVYTSYYTSKENLNLRELDAIQDLYNYFKLFTKINKFFAIKHFLKYIVKIFSRHNLKAL